MLFIVFVSADHTIENWLECDVLQVAFLCSAYFRVIIWQCFLCGFVMPFIKASLDMTTHYHYLPVKWFLRFSDEDIT